MEFSPCGLGVRRWYPAADPTSEGVRSKPQVRQSARAPVTLLTPRPARHGGPAPWRTVAFPLFRRRTTSFEGKARTDGPHDRCTGAGPAGGADARDLQRDRARAARE